LKTLDKLTTGKSNFEDVLASQKCVFGKAGLGFYPQSKEKKFTKPFSNFPEKQSVKISFQPVVTCFYCMKKSHSVSQKLCCVLGLGLVMGFRIFVRSVLILMQNLFQSVLKN